MIPCDTLQRLSTCKLQRPEMKRLPALTCSLLALLAAAACGGTGNLLRNPDLTLTDSKPAHWRVYGDDPIKPVTGPTGRSSAIEVTINTVAAGLGQITQRVNAKPEFNYRVAAFLRSDKPGLASLQLKFYQSGKEIQRLEVDKSKADWSRIESEITTPPGTDQVEVLCRYVRTEAAKGRTVAFAGVELVELGAKVFVPPRVASLEAIATFENIGIELKYGGDVSPAASATLRYRKKGEDAWMEALPLVHRPSEGVFRGSVLNVDPDTDYQLECTLTDPRGTATGHATVRTWGNGVPVGRVVRLPRGTSDQPLVISDKGTPDGWILYTSADAESLLDAGTSAPSAIHIKDAAYVILDKLTIRGGAARGIYVTDSNHIRIRNCDISGWGDPGRPDESLEHGRYVDVNGKLINWQAGVHVGPKSSQVVVEGNFIHSPRGTANSWAHGHPAGPQGVILDMTAGNNVVRNNDIIGSQNHWWNDGIESMYNQYVGGGPHRDTDISGNIIAFANDDGTELDGGQINVRYFNNWVQWAYCGVSCAPNRAGPSYVYRNLFVLTGELRGRTNFGFKMGGDKFAHPGRSFLFHNTMISTNYGLSTGHYGTGATPITARNNLYLGGEVFLRGAIMDNYDLDHDLLQPGTLSPPDADQQANAVQAVPVFTNATAGDYRLAPTSPGVDRASPLPTLNQIHTGDAPDIGAIETGASETFPLRDGGLSAVPQMIRPTLDTNGRIIASLSLRAPRSIGHTWRAHPNSDWIACSPSSGDTGDAQQTITVTIDPSSLPIARHRGAITFRTDDGVCRTILLQFDRRHENPFSITLEAESGVIGGVFEKWEDPKASGGSYLVVPPQSKMNADGAVAFEFEVPADDVYYLHASARAPGPVAMTHDSFYVSVNEGPRVQWNLQHLGSPLFNWQVVSTNEAAAYPIPLTRGKHTVRFHPRESGAAIDAVRLSNEPF